MVSRQSEHGKVSNMSSMYLNYFAKAMAVTQQKLASDDPAITSNFLGNINEMTQTPLIDKHNGTVETV
jgi:hypothetical protein